MASALQGHIDCPSTFKEFLNVDKCVPTTTDQPTTLDSPGRRSEHVVGEEEEKMEETWPLPTQPPRKVALMALSVLDSVINVTQIRDSLKLWMNCKILCQKCIKTVSNKDQSTPILRNNENKYRSNFDKCEHSLRAFSVLIVLHYVHYVTGVCKINNEKISI